MIVGSERQLSQGVCVCVGGGGAAVATAGVHVSCFDAY